MSTRPLGVPVVDLDDDAGIVTALSDIGFVAVRGHGVPLQDLAAMRRLLVDLFTIDDETKDRLTITRDDYRGFIPIGYFTPNRDKGAFVDAYEGYKMHWECPLGHPVRGECELYGSNRWPDELPDMPGVVASWWVAMDTLSGRIIDALAAAVGMDADVLARAMDAPLTNTTLLHYLPHQADDPSPGFHAHKDITVVTILDPDPVGGLEVRTRDGEWLEAVCPPDALLVNVGDLLEVWSGGRLVSTPHRVSNPPGVERYSAPFFVVPNHLVVVKPLLEPLPGFEPRSVPVGAVTTEVWRTNWPDEAPSDADTHLGTIDP